MAVEIERKFLINKEKFFEADLKYQAYHITQGYILSKDATVRIRQSTENETQTKQAYITLKSKSNGISRLEYEYEIPFSDADEILCNLCHAKVSKTRYVFTDSNSGLIWEIDIFEDLNLGLCIAEVELISEDQEIVKPEENFILEDVSHDKKYSNLALALNPYSTW